MQGCNIPNLANTIWANLALCTAAIVTTFRGGYRLSQSSEVAITTFWVQRGVCGSIPASVQSKGKGVWLFPPLGSPAFPSGVGPLVSLLPAKAIRAVGVCLVDTGPAGSDRKFAIEAAQENAEALRYAADGFQNDRSRSEPKVITTIQVGSGAFAESV